MKTGVIIGRFQVDALHKGHLNLIYNVSRKFEKLVFVIGSANALFTDKNPLPFDVRVSLIKSSFPDADVLYLADHPDDRLWSENLDLLLASYQDVTLCHSRDSFKSHYYGKYFTLEIEALEGHSSTYYRKLIAASGNVNNSADFRAGIIYACEKRYPIVYSTVDIAILKYNDVGKGISILLGKKPNRNTWVLPGGFVDPADDSYLSAAGRELSEEVPRLDHHGLKYHGSYKIDDWRYRGTKDSIMTSLFITWKMSGADDAGDDLEQTKWFTLNENNINIIEPQHRVLWRVLMDSDLKCINV